MPDEWIKLKYAMSNNRKWRNTVWLWERLITFKTEILLSALGPPYQHKLGILQLKQCIHCLRCCLAVINTHKVVGLFFFFEQNKPPKKAAMSEYFSNTVWYVNLRQMHSTDPMKCSLLLLLCFTTGKQRCISYSEVKERKEEKNCYFSPSDK